MWFDVGDRVRELSDLDERPVREGVVQVVQNDSSCGDPECCGGPYPTYAVRWDDGEEDRYVSGYSLELLGR